MAFLPLGDGVEVGVALVTAVSDSSTFAGLAVGSVERKVTTGWDFGGFGSGGATTGAGVETFVMTLGTGVGVGSGAEPAGAMGATRAKRAGAPAGGGPETGVCK